MLLTGVHNVLQKYFVVQIFYSNEWFGAHIELTTDIFPKYLLCMERVSLVMKWYV